jgi:hypothetical protein
MQPGVDAVVPIISSVSAMVLFQFKNLAEQGKASAEVSSAMCPRVSLANQKISESELLELDKNCVRVYMQLGAEEGSACCDQGGAGAPAGPSAFWVAPRFCKTWGQPKTNN